jgi:hypothetical protein
MVPYSKALFERETPSSQRTTPMEGVATDWQSNVQVALRLSRTMKAVAVADAASYLRLDDSALKQ